MDIKRFEKLPLLGIMRGIGAEHMGGLVEALVGAGLEAIEVTMNTRGAAGIISEAKKAAGGRVTIGAGTVLSRKALDTALKAGADFIVTPVIVADVVRACVDGKVPVFPGALTPKEVFDAWEAGATMVKVFPASLMGPKYFTELKGPFNSIKLMAVGGVRVDNIAEYFSSGADAAAFGASVFKKEWLDKRDYASIRGLVKRYVDAVKAAVKQRG